jgi:hypothetical protein
MARRAARTRKTKKLGFISKNKFHRRIQKGGGTRKQFPELGEGRSTSIYIEPLCKDTAVLLSFYNPVKFKRILKNILYIMHILKEKKIPVFVAECVFNKASPEIPDADLIVHSESYMFYKEQLLNKLEPLVPEQYTKLVMLDGDVMFDAPDWLDQISNALNKYDVIQPYSRACWLMPDNKIIRSWKYGYAYAFAKKLKVNETKLHEYHPGFAWAIRRKTFRDLGGFYPNAIVGGGDMLFTYNFFRDTIPETWKTARLSVERWPEYHKNFLRVAPKVGFIEVRALHLFHGLQLNRQYTSRYEKLAKELSGNWDDHIKYNNDGMTEFRDPKHNTILIPYFKARDEDIPLEKALQVSKSGRRSTVPIDKLNIDEKIHNTLVPTAE